MRDDGTLDSLGEGDRSSEAAPRDPQRRRATWWFAAVLVAVFGVAIVIAVSSGGPGGGPSPEVPLPGASASVPIGRLAVVANPLDPGLQRAALERLSTTTGSVGTAPAPPPGRRLVIATIAACTDGTWRPDGVVAFEVNLAGAAPVWPSQRGAQPALADGVGTTRGCRSAPVTFEVPAHARVLGVTYLQLPYRVVRWRA